MDPQLETLSKKKKYWWSNKRFHTLLFPEEMWGNINKKISEVPSLKAKAQKTPIRDIFGQKEPTLFYAPVCRSIAHITLHEFQNIRASTTHYKNAQLLNPKGPLGLTYSGLKKLTARAEVTCIGRIFSSYKQELLELWYEEKFQGLGGKQHVLKLTLFKTLSVTQWSMKDSHIWEQNQVPLSNKLEMQSGLLTPKEYTTFSTVSKIRPFLRQN